MAGIKPDSCSLNTNYVMNYWGVERNMEVLLEKFELLQQTVH